MLAFGLNGVIAVLTALSFAEMASKFPESGGTYTFSKKVLSVEAAFVVGWVVWFASIVAGDPVEGEEAQGLRGRQDGHPLPHTAHR